MTSYVEAFSDGNGSDVFGINKSARANFSMIMEDNSVDTICASTNNSSLCDKQGLGISLSTPILMLSFGLLGNAIALIVLYTVRNEMKRTVFYTFLCGLAWTDLIGQLLTGPIAIVMYANNLKWVGGEPLCKYHGFVMVFFAIITPLFVCCMSLERVLALRFPYFHERVLNKRKALISITCCWLFVLFFCSLPFVGFGRYAHQFPGSWCFLNFHRESDSDTAYAYTFAILNVMMIGIIIISNFVVIYTLVRMRRTRKLNNSPSIERKNKVKSKMKVEEETQMVWFLCAITMVFTICWFPLNIHILINQVTGRIDYAADLIGCRMASINQILDPWLYILLRKKVIIKGFKFLRQLIFKEYRNTKRSNKFVTNYNSNTCHMNGSVMDKNVHELQRYNVRPVDELREPVETLHAAESDSSCSGVESDCEGEKVHLKSYTKRHRSATDTSVLNRSESNPCDTDNKYFKACSEANRKNSLPARL